MATAHKIVFFLYHPLTGAPLTGATPTFSTYKDTNGVDLAQPAISEIGGGAYQFTISFPTNLAVVFVVYSGGSAVPDYQDGYVRPEDWYIDYLLDMKDEVIGKWEIMTSGPDANRLVLYREDGTTVLKKFDLQTSAGAPTTVNPFKRIPV